MAKNSVFVASQFGLYTLSGLLFIPFLYRQYGDGVYGLIALAGFLTQYVGLVAHCVGNAIARFLNISLNQDNWQEANQIYSTALVANVGFIAVLSPLFAWGIANLDLIIDFPPDIAADFRFLVACNVLVFFITVLSGVFRTPIHAANRLDVSATLDMALLALRLLLLFTLIIVIGAKLWIIGLVDLGLALVNIVVLHRLCRKLTTRLAFQWKYVTRKWMRPVLNMAGWSIVTTLGSYMLVKTDVWMINRFVSKELAGTYAAILVWPNFLKQIGKQLAAVLAPVYMIDYAKGSTDRVARVSLSAAKLIGCFVALGTGVLCVAAKPLLVLWLGPGMDAHVVLFRIMIVYLTYMIGESVLWQIFMTMNKVHYSGIISICSGVLNIALSLTLISMGYGVIGVAVATAVSLLIASALAVPLMVCRVLQVSYRTVFWNHTCATLLLLLSVGATYAGFRLSSTSVLGGIAVFGGILAGGLAASYFALLSREERALIIRLANKARGIFLKAGKVSAG